MHFNTTIISAFLADEDITKTEDFWLIQTYQKPNDKRKDIVKALVAKLQNIVEHFPTFNAPLWNALFPCWQPLLDTVWICPLVGEHKHGNHIIRKDHDIYFVIDLLYVADFTRIVSQMEYILQNFLTYEIAKLCIQHDYPLQSENYIDCLNMLTFTNGLANYLAWNQTCSQYKFYTKKYEIYKEKAFGLLASAIKIQQKAIQQNILKSVITADFWDQFPSVAGLFYFDDIYQEFDMQGILNLYQQGPKDFIQTIFQSS